jgi:hypothetical protein
VGEVILGAGLCTLCGEGDVSRLCPTRDSGDVGLKLVG